VPSRPRRRFDDDVEPIHRRRSRSTRLTAERDDALDIPSNSTYRHPDTVRGPAPVPRWLPTSGEAVDEDLGVVKTGKEADVSLVHRADGERSAFLAAKRYRNAQHRMFHRDAGYLEGRRTRFTRENRAMANRTEFGRQLLAGQWAVAEFAILSRLWSAGAAVPYPVQLLGTEVMMELIGDADGTPAPRLAQLRPDGREARSLYRQLRAVLVQLAETGYTHGDLSAYNVLVHEGRLVLIDLPQAVDLVGNPQGFAYLRRDCTNICTWFSARGIDADADELANEIRRALV